ACGFRFYGGNTTPVNDRDEPLTFSDLAGSGGFLRLGILRMDLDNLGNIFQQGFLRESPDGNKIMDHTARYSISRLSNLSSLLDLFFTGYINTLCREKFNGQILIIYSGGDDLFLVGYWETVVNVARDIRRDFQAFTGQHPCFTISGGVALAPGKFPIHRGADLAGEAEEQAKNLDENKNAFSFMDKAVRWPDFMELEALKNEILTLTEDLDSMALISRLRRICWTYQEEKHRLDQQTLSPQDREEMINFNKWRWRMVYSLSRLTKKEKPALAERLEALKRRLTERLPSGNTIISALDIPVRWAEFTLRSETNQEEPAHDTL
ncbi:MAG: hypothetical protein ACE5D1_05840, partial [Fidelibacterota bacterium]